MQHITQIAFTYRKPVFLILLLLLVNGIIAYFTLPAREDPSITIREAIVSTRFPGMAPERVEQLITRKLEQEIRKIPEVTRLRSTSSTGLSIIHVKIYDRYFNLDNIWQDLRNKVEQAQSQLPSGTLPPNINDDFGDVSVVTLALTADGFDLAQMYDKAKHIRDSLYAVEGTKKVEILGVQSERVYLEVSNARLAQLGISPASLIRDLQTQNIIASGGEIDTGERSFIIEPTGNFNQLNDIETAYISIPGSEDFIALKDIANIRRGFIDPPHQPAYFNGKPALMLAISMLEGFNVLDFGPAMLSKIEQIQGSLPLGFNLDISTYQAEQVEKTVNGVSINVIQTLAIVLVVVVIFLGVRTGLIVGSIVPFVMLATLAIMQLSGMDLQRMSLATLIIALGLLVDNGIVIAEDFKSRLEQGKDRMTALTEGGAELAMPLLSSSITTVLFFLPLMLAQHVAGEYTRSISLVILITLMTSWVMALCITPVLCYYFIGHPKTDKTSLLERLYDKYTGLLHGVLTTRTLLLAGIFILLIGSVLAMKLVPKQFFPDSDRQQILMYIDLPQGSSASTTDRQMRDIFAWLQQSEYAGVIDNFTGYVGFNGPRFVLSLNPEDPQDNKGFIVMNVKPGTDLKALLTNLDRDLEQRYPDVAARVRKMFLGPSDSSVLQIQVKGPDKDVIYRKSQQVMQVLRDVPGTYDIRNNWENRIVKVEVQVDQHRARRSGITSKDVATSLQTFFSGAQITDYREGDDIIPVVLRAGDAERHNIDRLRTLSVYSQTTGVSVPLLQVADFAPVNQYGVIQRENLFRTVTIEGRNNLMAAEDLKTRVDAQIQQLADDLPLNHWIEYDGVVVESAAAQKALSASMPLVMGFIVLLLVAQFNSFRRALIIMLTIPLSFIGAVLGLLVMGAPFGFMVSLGLYSLAGIIINNAIVLIDRIDLERRDGKSDYDAIVSACRSRLRPITMTTITTVMGLLPLILGHDALFYGMACVIAFGLGVGTILTLGVVPVLYSVFFKVKRES
ncbi:efflux RND transporter permease subunit [Bowmanella sp. JS7-9]|uniref:Efflux RND transporter permease subunit n=1 Tax=Pseudobowmanella zhangzhouensis TaxID=1537679 RepID=A0ABW1XK25_9ALTE|nr:efflux RND transporter permease subunit [Bowmanella sp. JS7-9]TBX21053.1 acriflavine resistance protein B [Bowmanella sp. JS7-9]